jgi:hypothetical protein
MTETSEYWEELDQTRRDLNQLAQQYLYLASIATNPETKRRHKVIWQVLEMIDAEHDHLESPI